MKKIYPIIFVLFTLALVMAGCAKDSGGLNESGGGGTGKGGSMARFTIAGDYIYTVDDHNLKITYIADPANPKEINGFPLHDVSGDIETIFPYDGKLFIGSRSAMYIYDISVKPKEPQFISKTNHFRSCDPVVAYGNTAYVTLNNASVNCGGRGDFLLLYDITDLKYPVLSKSYQYTGTIHPAGLGVDGPAGKLFVCTNVGVEVYDITDNAVEPIKYIGDLTELDGVGILDAYDLIPMDGLLIVVGKDGLFQFDYTEEEIILLSSLDLRKK